MELIDNKSKLLGDDLGKEITKGTKLRMVASYFSIYAFEALREELSEIEDLQFIFPSPTFVSKGIQDNIKKEKHIKSIANLTDKRTKNKKYVTYVLVNDTVDKKALDKMLDILLEEQKK